MTSKPRILWVSNSMTAPSGYGQQTAVFVPRLVRAGYETALFAFFGLEGAPLKTDGIVILPRVAQSFGNDIVGAYMQMTGSDLALSLIDPHALEPSVYGAFPWCAWTPIDCTPAHKETIRCLAAARWIWTLSPHGHRQLLDAGVPAAKLRYVPHGIRTDVFKPGDRSAARKSFGLQVGATVPDGAYLVAMVAANKGVPSRKGFYEAFRAVAILQQRHPDVWLYVHSEITGINVGENLREVATLAGLNLNQTLYPSQAHLLSGQLPPDYLNAVYNAADIYLSASHGEGFGIPIVEAQASGCPVVVADNTAQSDLCFAGWKTPCITYMPTSGVTWERPLVDALVGNLESAYRARDKHELRAQARAGAERFDAERVWSEHMAPALDGITAELGKEKARRRLVYIPAKADERPDVSVLMPVYRISSYPHAAKAIQSALDQEGVRVQVVLVDDGSDDDTYAQIQALAAADARIVAARCDRREKADSNGHLTDNIPPNVAARHATGRYFIWGSSRAWYEPGAFKSLVTALDANPGIGFAYGATRYYGGRDDLYQPDAFAAEAFRSNFVSLQGYLYRREAWDGGTRYRSAFDYLYPADRDYVNQLVFGLKWKGLSLPVLVYHYEYSADSMTAKSNAMPEVQALWKQTWEAV
jgi:glycosyltransferase involved in cell wall biosynthesis